MYDADAPKDAQAEPVAKLVLTDADFLSIVAEQRRQSIGFGFANDGALASDREQALNYFKGEMADIPALENRSRAVSTDIADAIETIMPDLVEILTGGDDIATFQPVGAEDEAAAEQETDYIRHVLLHENDGFLVISTAVKDSLLTKAGVLKYWWDATSEEIDEQFDGKSAVELMAAMQAAEGQGAEIKDVEAGEDGSYSFRLCGTKNTGRERVVAVPSEDFTVARDTVILREAAYCAMRSRPRVHDLIADGFERDVVENLPAYSGSSGGTEDETIQLARDTAGEHSDGTATVSTHRGLQVVEVVEHYIRLDADDDGKPELWKVVTGGGETVFIAKERVSQVPFALLTPYLVPHRLLGRSVGDVLAEIQRIKTALLRMLLDSGYFALNQRMEVSIEQSNQWTISDLLRNGPNVPVRSKNGNAVRPLSSGSLNFDVQGALEYVSVMGEQRSGIKRHSMGLNPDTLHDTASGALGQLNEAMKRVRFIARTFAETGLKDLLVGMHSDIRTNATSAAKIRLRGSWTDIDPTRWGERKDMVVEIGIGSGGREHKLMGLNMLANLMEKVFQTQGGVSGPLATPEHAARLLNKFPAELGLKGNFFASADEVKAAAGQAQPQPDPKMVEAQGRMQEAQAKAQLAQQESAAKLQLAQQDAAARLDMERERGAQEFELKRGQIEAEMALKREQLSAELDLKREQMAVEAQLKAAGVAAGAPVSPNIGGVYPGGEPG